MNFAHPEAQHYSTSNLVTCLKYVMEKHLTSIQDCHIHFSCIHKLEHGTYTQWWKFTSTLILHISQFVVLPIQQVGFNCGTFPPWGLQGKLPLIIPSPCIFSSQSTTLSYTTISRASRPRSLEGWPLQTLHTVNNVEVTFNTCTCTDVFTITTTKDQSDGIYNSYSTGG